MYLKSLTLRGFKSFASTTTLNFEPGLTAIVGPNGSGKSNIVDALSWVMGQQGVKSLRGTRMEDVIFAGTTGRAPLGRAEVTLTIDNSDQALPIDFSEVTISRTLFRSGGSEYAINGRACRLLDVQELLSDTGMGREMHVVVGQGQLDAILAATPELRRGFIEEAAGVLKHRRRKEKAVRKLEATQANLDRLTDLIAEIRRQLKPLGRQAEVARRAALVQANLRDAKARLLADELAQATEALQAGEADEAAGQELREHCQAEVDRTRADEQHAEQETAAAQPALAAAQELWYGLAGLRERVRTTASIAAERRRSAEQAQGSQEVGRDPVALEAEAAQVRAQEQQLRAEVAAAEQVLGQATHHREDIEAAYEQAERAYAQAVRAVADRREGLAKLDGQVNSLRSRLQAGAEEDARLVARVDEARQRATQAEAAYAELADGMSAQDGGQVDLDAAFERADDAWTAATEQVERWEAQVGEQDRQRTGLVARLEALELSLDTRDAAGAVLARPLDGLVGRLSGLVEVEPSWRSAVAAALGRATDALVVADTGAGAAVLDLLKAESLGRAHAVVAGAPEAATPQEGLPDGARWALDAVRADAGLRGAMSHLLGAVALVDDAGAARNLVERRPDVTAVTRDGDVWSSWQVTGGSSAGASRLEVEQAAQEAREQLAVLDAEREHVSEQRARAEQDAERARVRREAALAALDESDSALRALAEQATTLAGRVQSASAEAERIEQSIAAARARRLADEEALAQAEQRRQAATEQGEDVEPDPAQRDDLSGQARVARQSEMDARLALRTAEERAKALAGRAEALLAAARAERDRQAAAAARLERLRREGEVARAVAQAAGWLGAQVDAAQGEAAAQRDAAEQTRVAAEAALARARQAARAAAAELDRLVEGAHREELVRIEQRMRVENLTGRAMTELGLEASVLIDEYGPDQLIPVLLTPQQEASGVEQPEPVPYERAEQAARLRQAEQDLATLGRVNPLALEEFDAMNERHGYLAGQLDDLRRTRQDLLGIIDEVDARVQEVFEKAYADVSETFSQVFARLFPGGVGRLVLTDPGDMLGTGIEVEASPAGKRVKRLSLLSGGERSLVAVAFLLSLFIARPSPFYILDEVEAALDDANLGRLLEVYADLRRTSQLLVITHQKRTMEIADALYGITMRGDGVTTVVSQRLSE